jgi:hypothetical protein
MQKLAAGLLGTTLLAGLVAIYFWQQLQSEREWNTAAPCLVGPVEQRKKETDFNADEIEALAQMLSSSISAEIRRRDQARLGLSPSSDRERSQIR